jgi:tetratricopeptide (TPR) repeat protein
MHQSAKFWILLAIFQVAFGVTIYSFTRHFYIDGADGVVENTIIESEQIQEWTNEYEQNNSPMLDALTSFSANTTQDPEEIYRLANMYFADKQYDKAAEQYERLLSFDSGSATAHNNLGITLHYLGRSTEALRILDEGIALEPTNQRIWLTLGFVNKELGNNDEARAALTTATQMSLDNEVGKAAARMLATLP